MDTRTPFDLLCDAADKLDVGALVALYNQGARIDCKDSQGLKTPTAEMASRGNHEAVKLLREFGADVSHIALGYAVSNYSLEAKALIRNNCVHIKCIALAVGMSYDENFRSEIGSEFDLAPEWIIFGAVLSEQYDFARQLLENLRLHYEEYKDAASAAVYKSSFLTFQYASKMKVGQIYATNIMGGISGIAGFMAHLLWIEKLHRNYMTVDDVELQRLINSFYNKKILTNIPASKRLIDLQSSTNMLEIGNWIDHCDLQYHPSVRIYELTFAEDKEFLLKLGTDKANFSDCCKEAENRRKLMHDYQFNYYQAGLFLANDSVHTILTKSVENNGVNFSDSLRQLLEVPGIEAPEAIDMLDKYYLFCTKQFVIQLIDEFCHHNNGYFAAIVSNPKISRLTNLKIGIGFLTSIIELHELLCFECGLFEGSIKPDANPLLPEHLQPLKNPNTDQALINLFKQMVRSQRFKRILSDQPDDCGIMVNYRDITAPKPIDPDNFTAVVNVQRYFNARLSRFVDTHGSAITSFNLFGNKLHKVERVEMMREAAARATSRRELISIALFQFGLYKHLIKPKPNEQAPKHLQLMSSEPSNEFRHSIEDLLTCDALKPKHFK